MPNGEFVSMIVSTLYDGAGKPLNLAHAIPLETLELRPSLEAELQFIPVPDLEDEDLMAGMAEMGERLQEIGDLPEAVRDDDQQPAPVQFRDEVVEDLAEFGFATGLPVLKFIQNRPEMAYS